MELSQNPNQQSPRVRLNLNSDIENIENLTPQRFYTSLNTERKNYLSLYKTSVQREVKSVPDFGCLNSNWICLKSSPVKAGGRVSPQSDNHMTRVPACEEGPGIFAKAMALGSLLLVIFSLPVSLFFVVKVVQVLQHSNSTYTSTCFDNLEVEFNPDSENFGY